MFPYIWHGIKDFVSFFRDCSKALAEKINKSGNISIVSIWANAEGNVIP